jgi:segregation and condensation protein B
MSKAAKNTGNDSPALTEEMRILEALLFASDDLLTPAKIKKIMPGEPDARNIRKLVNEINAHLQRERHPFEIVELAGGYQFRTVAYYHPWLRKLLQERSVKKLSIQALECLAIVAYKQPLSKAEIEAIRGVLSDGAMKTLLERRLITVGGRSDKPGRPLLYVTTPEFLRYFGINKLDDLPSIEEFEALAREKMEEISDEAFSDMEEAAGVTAMDDGEDTNGEGGDEAVDILGENGSEEMPEPSGQSDARREDGPESADGEAGPAHGNEPLLEEQADLAEEDSPEDEPEGREGDDTHIDDSLVDEPSIPTRVIDPPPGSEPADGAEGAIARGADDTDEDEGDGAAPADILGEGVPAEEETQAVSADELEEPGGPVPDDAAVRTQEVDLPERVEDDGTESQERDQP